MQSGDKSNEFDSLSHAYYSQEWKAGDKSSDGDILNDFDEESDRKE
jgi:hypothetical protein